MIKKFLQFFFPDDTKVKVECRTDWAWNGKELVLHREFYTFRSLWSFATTEYIINPTKDLGVALQQPTFAYKTAFSLIIVIGIIKNIVSINNLTLIMGAVAFDAITSSASATSPISFSHTCSGVNRVLTVGASYGNVPSNPATYNSVSMTSKESDGNNQAMVFWWLPAPAIGSNTVSIPMAFDNQGAGGAISFTGADQTNVGATINASGNSVALLQASLTTLYANSFLVDSFCMGSVTPPTVAADAGQTERYNGVQTTLRYAGSTKPTTTAGSYTLGWSWTGTKYPQMMILEIPEAGAVPVTNIKSYNTNLKANIKSLNTNLMANIKSINTNV